MRDDAFEKLKRELFINLREELSLPEIIPFSTLKKKLPKNIIIAPFSEAELQFRSGATAVIDPSLGEPGIIQLFKKLELGISLSDDERQHVLTAEEFYRARRDIFLQRARETASKHKELKFIKAILRTLPRNAPVLDAGCGMGRLALPLLKEGFNVSGIDLSPDLIERARLIAPGYRDRFNVGNILDTKLKNNSFRVVLLMWHIITEVHDHLEVLFAEMRRILVPGGILILDFPDVTSDKTKLRYNGKSGEDYSIFLAKVPAAGILVEKLSKTGFEVKMTERFLWGIHKYVVVCRKR